MHETPKHETRKASFDTFEAYFCQRDDRFRLSLRLFAALVSLLASLAAFRLEFGDAETV